MVGSSSSVPPSLSRFRYGISSIPAQSSSWDRAALSLSLQYYYFVVRLLLVVKLKAHIASDGPF